jgi:lycopene beta-cyclase
VLLNRLMFGAFGLEAQRNVLERFYRLPEATIERFYALALSPADQLRILCGRPPSGLSLRRVLSREARA